MADGQEQILEITGGPVTVRDILEHMEIDLGPLDRVEPDLYVEATDGLDVVVTRVEEAFETERQVLPFVRETVRSEAVPEGQLRLLQPGLNGEEEITYKVTLEDGVEVAREEVRREVVVDPVKEIVLVGVQGELAAVPVTGTIVYLSGGNAWLVRESTDLRRNITGSGDLDGRVFALSNDGAYLVFTRGMQGDVDTALNSLWLARTSLVGEEPQYLGITGVIWAGWAPDGRRVAYSTAERSGGVPGWKANNDLWLITFPEEDGEGEIVIEQLLEATAEIPYAWWGRTYAWSPDGNFLAYAQADGIGILSPDVGQPIPLVRFAPYRTQSSWAWVPGLSWSPDSYLLAYVAHEADPEGADPEESQVFGLWVASIDGTLKLRLAEEVGMWAGPRWSPVLDGLLAFGQAQTPNNSQDSRYDLYVMDRDGSNMRHLFPEEGMLGLIAPEVAWSPEGDSLILEYEGDLYRIDIRSEQVDQLTSDGQSTHPRWAR
jgi:Tol biopolymer transport system component